MSTRALIVDDHPIVRDALVSSLVSLNVFDEVETANSFHELLQMLELDASYELLILDLSLTDVSGPDGMVYIREYYSDIPILVFSASDTADIISQCFEHGVHGFVSKNTSMQVFVHAIGVVLAGGIYIPPPAVEQIVGGFSPSSDSGQAPEKEQVHFTPKQHAVFQQLMMGVPNKVIGRRLELAEGTVKAHLHSIYKTLGVSNRAQAILKAQKLGIDASAPRHS